MTNYAALGEYTAYSRQATDAASRRFSLMQNLSHELKRMSESPTDEVNTGRLSGALEDIYQADAEMRAALKRANEAAVLCGERPVTLPKFGAM